MPSVYTASTDPRHAGRHAAGMNARSAPLDLLMGKQFEEFEDGGVVLKYRRHSNGRGLVAMSAKADPSAFIAPTAYIESDARVDRDAQVGDGTWIERDCIIGRGARIGANVRIGAGAVIGAGAQIGSHSRVGPGASVAAATRVPHDSNLPAHAQVRGSDFRRAA
jgi:UDP-3-O-[3-hydroxymyristoyl] glucosamine N-acyltransferase